MFQPLETDWSIPQATGKHALIVLLGGETSTQLVPKDVPEGWPLSFCGPGTCFFLSLGGDELREPQEEMSFGCQDYIQYPDQIFVFPLMPFWSSH